MNAERGGTRAARRNRNFPSRKQVSRADDSEPKEKKNSRRRNYGTKISRPEGITIFRKGWLCSGWVCVVQVNRRIRSGVDGLVAAMAHLWSKFTKCLRASEGASNPDKVLATPFGTYPTRKRDREAGEREMVQRRVIRYYYIVAITISRRQRPSSNPLFSDLRPVYRVLDQIIPKQILYFQYNRAFFFIQLSKFVVVL